MAALEKIRKRSVVLVVVIGLGLLAFILEEGVRASSSFFNDTTVARIDNEKIDVQEFNTRYEQLNQNNQTQGQDGAVMQQQLLQQMAMETILEREYDDDGIDVSGDELATLLNNNQQALQMTQTIAQQLGQNIQSPSQLDKLIQSDPQRFQLVAAPWNEMKKQAYDQMRSMKLYALVSQAIAPNSLDLLALQEENADTYTVQFAKADVSSLDDAKFKPTEAEIKAVYDQYKELYRVTDEQTLIHYIAVPIEPSAKDLETGKAVVAKATAAIALPNGLDSLRSISEFSNVNTTKVTAEQAKQAGQQLGDSTLEKFITASAVGATHSFNRGNAYTLYKLTDVAQLTDTAKVVIVSVQGDKAVQDKALADLNAGKDLSKQKGIEIQPEQPLQLQNPQLGLADDVKDKIEKAEIGKYIVLNSDPKQGAALVKVNSKTTKTFYTIATSGYELVASTATVNAAQDRLENFLLKNKTAADFSKNAVKAGFNMQQAIVNSSVAQLGGIPNSRKAIRWALTEAKDGEVSNVFVDNHDVLVAVAVDKKYEGEFMPLENEQVRQFCEAKAIAIKKVKALETQYKGKANDIARYAKLMNGKVDTTTVTFGFDQVNKINCMPLQQTGSEGDQGIIGAVAAAKQGAVTFYAGNSAVYAFVVTKKEASQMKLNKDALKNNWTMRYGVMEQGQMGANRFSAAVFGAAKIKNNMAKFM